MTLFRDSYRNLHSSETQKRPLSIDLLDGELAINYEYSSPGLYFKDTQGKIRKAGPAHVGILSPQPTNYTDLSDGEFWIDRSGSFPVLRFWQEEDQEWVGTQKSVSVEDLGGDGSLAYNDETGVISYTGPSSEEVRAHFSGGTGVSISDGEISVGQDISTTSDVIFNDLTLTGSILGPANLVIDPAVVGDSTGKVTILGDLDVQGTTTTIDSVNLEIDDKNITLGRNAIDSTQVDGGGITLSGADATILYESLSDSWNFNKQLGIVDGTESLPSYSFSSDRGYGLYLGSGKDVFISTDGQNRLGVSTLGDLTLYGSKRFIFDQSGVSGTLEVTTLTESRSYTLPDVSGTIVTTGDTGTVTSVMIADGTVVNADISANAEIAVSKLADGSARQLLQTDAAGTGVEWTDDIDVPGTLDVTGIATFDNLISIGAAQPTTSQQVGWNPDKGTLDIGLLNGVLSPLGQDIITLCRNGTASPIPIGTAVMFTGETDGNSGRLYIAPMVADGTYPGYVLFGVAAQNIAAGADGYVRSFGEVKGVDTDIDEGGVDGQWAEGDILWCDPATPGGFTKFEPQAPNLKLPVAAVVSVKNNGIIMVRWDTGRRFSDLHDVEISSELQGDEIISYNSVTKRWENKNDITVSGSISTSSNIILESQDNFTTTLQAVTPTEDRRISLPDSSGTIALVSGLSGQLIYNYLGVYKGLSESYIDSSGNLIWSALAEIDTSNSPSGPPLSLTGSWFSGGTGTTTKPQLLVEPSGTVSDSWNTNGTGIGINAPSNFTGKLLDLQLNSTSNFSVNSTGTVSVPLGSSSGPSIYFGTHTNTGIYSPGADELAISTGGIQRLSVNSDGRFFIETPSIIGSGGVIIRNGNTTSESSLFLGQLSGNLGTEIISKFGDLSGYTSLSISSSDFSVSTEGIDRLLIDSEGLITTTGSFKDPAITGTILEEVYTISDGVAFEVDPSNGSVQLITLGASRTPKATNFAAGEAVTLMIDDGTAYTLTWTDTTWGASGVVWTGGSAPTLATSGYTVVQFWKVGTQVYGAYVGDVA